MYFFFVITIKLVEEIKNCFVKFYFLNTDYYFESTFKT